MHLDPSFADRAAGAFLGLACGDAFGRTLEFESGPKVRTQPVSTSAGSFCWTDDTHMALYLADAVLAQPPGPLDDDRFGASVGEAFVRWLDDPLTPSTAPGGTCLRGAGAFRAGRDWRASGVPESDGCGAVMRVVPVGIAFAGEELDRAAAVQALVTHGHSNAREAAVVACRILRAALERGRLDAAIVEEARAALDPRGLVSRALGAALAGTSGPEDGWLDESAVPEDRGGWRSASALGLALTAALRWGVGRGAEGFASAVEKAARIDGDSDSVAALAGMFLGAAGGLAAIPTAWRAAVQDGARIEAVARELAVRGEPWLAVADLHGRPDRLEALVAWGDARFASWRLALLGDYVDNGPGVQALLDLVITLQAKRGDRVVAIAGNHDVVCARALATLGTPEGGYWYDRWTNGHWNPQGSTPEVYGLERNDVAGLAAVMKPEHRAFLCDLPWFCDAGRWLFVHAGMETGPLAPQLEILAGRPSGEGRFRDRRGRDVGLPPQIRGHTLDRTADPGWDRVVVSAHTHQEDIPFPAWIGENRITLWSCDRPRDDVVAVLLPDRLFLRVSPGGGAEVVPMRVRFAPGSLGKIHTAGERG